MTSKKNLDIKGLIKTPKVIVGAFIFNDKDELLLLKSKKWQNKYTCPGGHVEYNEKLETAVRREVLEETGLKVGEISFLNISEAVNLADKYKSEENHYVYINFKAKTKDTNVKLDTESSGYKWLPVDEWKKRNDLGINIMSVLEVLSQDSYEDMYKRALADYQNLVKQTLKEKQEFARYANEQILLELLPVYDNLKISLSHIDEAASQNGWAEGIKYVVKQFKDVLSGVGVEEIETEGQAFDHHTMEAVEGEGEKVKKEIKSGYKLHGKLISPAKVILE